MGPMFIFYNDEIAKKTPYDGYYTTMYGDVVSVKVKGGQGSLDYSNPRLHSYKEDKDGYKECCISIVDDFGNHKRIYKRAHRLVWESWFGEIPNNLTIDHIDRNKINNDITNLRLLTRSQNTSLANKNRPCNNGLKKMYNLYSISSGELVGTYSRKDLEVMFNIPSGAWKRHNENNYSTPNGFLVEEISTCRGQRNDI